MAKTLSAQMHTLRTKLHLPYNVIRILERFSVTEVGIWTFEFISILHGKKKEI